MAADPTTPSHRLPCFLHSLSTSDRVTTPPRFLRAVVVGFQEFRCDGGGVQAVGFRLLVWEREATAPFQQGPLSIWCVALGSPAQTCPPFQKQHVDTLPSWCCCGADVIPVAQPGPILRNTEPVCCGSWAGVEVGPLLLHHSGSRGGEPGLESNRGGSCAMCFFLSGRVDCTLWDESSYQ